MTSCAISPIITKTVDPFDTHGLVKRLRHVQFFGVCTALRPVAVVPRCLSLR